MTRTQSTPVRRNFGGCAQGCCPFSRLWPEVLTQRCSEQAGMLNARCSAAQARAPCGACGAAGGWRGGPCAGGSRRCTARLRTGVRRTRNRICGQTGSVAGHCTDPDAETTRVPRRASLLLRSPSGVPCSASAPGSLNHGWSTRIIACTDTSTCGEQRRGSAPEPAAQNLYQSTRCDLSSPSVCLARALAAYRIDAAGGGQEGDNSENEPPVRNQAVLSYGARKKAERRDAARTRF